MVALILDDQPDIAEMMRDLVEDRGYTVYTAYSCDQAIEVTKRNEIDIFVVDINLGQPGKNGDDFARSVQGKGKLIMFTGLDLDASILRGIEYSAFFTKGSVREFLLTMEELKKEYA